MDTLKRNDRLVWWVAILTWCVVAWPFARDLVRVPEDLRQRDVVLAGVCLVGFVVLFLASYRIRRADLRLTAMALQTLLALTLIGLSQSGFEPILLVIVAAQAANCFTLVRSFVWSAGQSVAMYAIVSGSDWRAPLFTTLAYFGFQSFAIIASHVARSESDARMELERVHAELESAMSLLSLNSRIAERARISRDLHDVLGHHLTALSINLEVASHLTEGKAKEQIESSQAIAKSLLTDVRATVSRLRSDDSVDLHDAIAGLVAVFPRPAIHVEIDDTVASIDPLTAEVILRCCQEAITNAARHSGATNVYLTIQRSAGEIRINSRDDGIGASKGSDVGLRSIRERVEARGGSVSAESPACGGFVLFIAIPDTTGGQT